MRYRERTLLHFTGRDCATNSLYPSEPERRKLVERLVSILEEGFWLAPERDTITGGYVGPSRVRSAVDYHPNAYRACFTDLPISRVFHHAVRYGGIAIGVDRRFILDRWGAPVHYVRNHPDEVMVYQHHEVARSLTELSDFLETAREAGALPDAVSQSLGAASEACDNARRAHSFIRNFLKEMSEDKTDDFRYIGEHEWRIVNIRSRCTPRRAEVGREVPDTRRGFKVRLSFVDETDQSPPRYRSPFDRSDVELIVFPDAETRALALREDRFCKWFTKKAETNPRHLHAPVLLTMEETKTFEREER